MKRLLSVPVTRDHIPNEWISSESQSTMAGLNAFAARQKARMTEAQTDAAEAQAKVRKLGQRK